MCPCSTALRGVVARVRAEHTCAAHPWSAACTPTGQRSAWLDMCDFVHSSHKGYALASAGCPRHKPPAPAAQQVAPPSLITLTWQRSIYRALLWRQAGAGGMQVAQYVISGLTQALDNCSQASAAPYGAATVGAITRTNVNKAAVMVSHLSSLRPQ